MMRYFISALLIVIFFGRVDGHPVKSLPKPFFTSREISRVATGARYDYHFTASDSNGKPLTFSAEALPAWLHFNAKENTVSGKPLKTGQFPVHLIVSNGTSIARQNFMLTVYDVHTINILPIGNSLTNGTSIYNSYRRVLWQLLHAGHYNFDLVGSWSKHHMGGDVPNPDFDMDHEGHSGWTFEQVFNPPGWDSIRGNIRQWLTLYTPDIVLIELGTNDVFQCRKTADVIKDLSDMVQLLREKNKQVKIFVAQIPPLGTRWASKRLCGNNIAYDMAIRELNKAILTFTLANTRSLSPVTAIDQYTGVNPAKNMYDDIHPNEYGEKIMAQRWFAAIKKYLPKL